MVKASYRELDVWQKAMDLAEQVYAVAKFLPADERFGLVTQLQRAAVSLPANIAEGYGHSHRGDYLHHLSIARGSLCEVETLLTLAVRLKMLDRNRVVSIWSLAQDVGKMLRRLSISLRKNSVPTADTRHPIPG